MTTAPPANDPWQVLDTAGNLRDAPGLPPAADALDLRAAYRDMVLARRVDIEAVALQRQGELGLWPSMLGQEGAQVGAGRALKARDVVFPTYREHAVAWCSGVDPVRLLGLFRGTTLGGWDPRERNFHLYTLVIGAQTLHAVGYAMAVVRDGDVGTGQADRDRAVLVFLGDGALSEGETNEAFVWAAAQHLPVVFFCQNNQWAISAPFSVQSRIPAADTRPGLRLPRRPRRRQRRGRLPRRHPHRAGERPRRRRPHPDRGGHLPPEPAHHLRRRPALPHRLGERRVGRARPDRASAHPAHAL